MQTDNVCREPVNIEAVRAAVRRYTATPVSFNLYDLFSVLLAQGVLNPTEIAGAKVERAIVIDLPNGSTVVVNSQGLVL